jgi:hypothetical protein
LDRLGDGVQAVETKLLNAVNAFGDETRLIVEKCVKREKLLRTRLDLIVNVTRGEVDRFEEQVDIGNELKVHSF